MSFSFGTIFLRTHTQATNENPHLKYQKLPESREHKHEEQINKK